MNRISVIIPTLNEAGQIDKLIDSLRSAATSPLHEIIIADGGSSDGTQQIAEQAGIRVVRCKQRGRSLQMNGAAQISTGDLLYFLHADTLPPTGFDSRILQANAEGYAAGCFQLQFDDPHPLLRLYGWFTRFNIDLIRFGDQSLFITRDLFRKIGGFREDLILMEDQEIIRRIRRSADFKLFEERVVTSARKYRKNGVLRLQWIFFMILIGYYAGASQEALTHLYRSSIKT